MTTRTYLLFDVSRCDGKTVDGLPVIPCNTCARRIFRDQIGERTPFTQWQPAMGHCPHFISMEVK